MKQSDVVIVREAGGLSESGDQFPDLFVAEYGANEDCVIKGEQLALWRFFDQLCEAEPLRMVPLAPFGQLGYPQQ